MAPNWLFIRLFWPIRAGEYLLEEPLLFLILLKFPLVPLLFELPPILLEICYCSCCKRAFCMFKLLEPVRAINILTVDVGMG